MGLSGCMLPAPLMYLNYLRMGVDTVNTLNDNKTSTDVIISGFTDKECKTSNIFQSKDYCNDQTTKDYFNGAQ